MSKKSTLRDLFRESIQQPETDYLSLIEALPSYQQSFLFTLSACRGITLDALLRSIIAEALSGSHPKFQSELEYYRSALSLGSTFDLMALCRRNPDLVFDRVTAFNNRLHCDDSQVS